MCGDVIADVVDAGIDVVSSGDPLTFGNVAAEFAPKLAWNLVEPSTVDGDTLAFGPQTRLDEVKDMAHKENKADINVDNVETFEKLYEHMISADYDIAPGHAEQWAGVARAIEDATTTFAVELRQSSGWRGQTHDAAMENVFQSFPEPTTAAHGAHVMGILVDAFQNTISATKLNVVLRWEDYKKQLDAWPEYRDEIRNNYNNFAQKVMQEVYAPNIRQIAKDNPGFTQGGAR